MPSATILKIHSRRTCIKLVSHSFLSLTLVFENANVMAESSSAPVYLNQTDCISYICADLQTFYDHYEEPGILLSMPTVIITKIVHK